MTTKLEQASFLTLDGMRGLGAMMVVFAHLSGVSFFLGKGVGLSSAVPLVDVFFVISGFVIAYSYEPRFQRGMTTGQFMLARLVRLYPLYLVGFAMGLSVILATYIGGANRPVNEVVVGGVLQLFMMPGPDSGPEEFLYSMNVPAWTLFFELAINLVYILAWPLIRNLRVVVGLMIAGAVTLVVFSLQYGATGMGPHWEMFWGGFSRVTYGFFAGVMIYRLAGMPRKTATRRSWQAVAIVLALLPFAMIPAPKSLEVVVALFQVILFAPLLVFFASRVQPPKSLQKLFFLGGAVSYAIYMVHYPLYMLAKRIAYRLPEVMEPPAPWSGMLLMAAVVPLAYAAHKWFDEPVRARINTWIKTRRRTSPERRTSAG